MRNGSNVRSNFPPFVEVVPSFCPDHSNPDVLILPGNYRMAFLYPLENSVIHRNHSIAVQIDLISGDNATPKKRRAYCVTSNCDTDELQWELDRCKPSDGSRAPMVFKEDEEDLAVIALLMDALLVYEVAGAKLKAIARQQLQKFAEGEPNPMFKWVEEHRRQLSRTWPNTLYLENLTESKPSTPSTKFPVPA